MKKMKKSLLIANISKVCALAFFIIYFMVPAYISSKTSLSGKTERMNLYILMFSQCVCWSIHFVSLRIYKTDSHKKLSIVPEECMSEEFNKLYEILKQERLEDLNLLKKYSPLIKVLKWSAIAVAVSLFFIGMSLSTYIDIIVFWLCMFAAILMGVAYCVLEFNDIKFDENYKAYYKRNCIKHFIKFVNPNFVYEPQNSNKEESMKLLYDASKCDDIKGTDYLLDDYIECNLDDETVLKLIDMHVIAAYVHEEEVINGIKHVHNYKPSKPIELFEGIFGVLENKHYIKNHLRIHNSDKEYNQSKLKISMDSAEFEEYFNVLCSDKILAARIVTAEIMEMLVEFYKKYYLEFEIILYEDKIYMRFFTGKMFEPEMFGDVLTKETLATYYTLLQFIIEISKEIDKVMKNFEL